MYFEGFANADKKKMNEEQLDRYKEKLDLYQEKANHYKNLIKERMLDSNDNEPDTEDEDKPVNKQKKDTKETKSKESKKSNDESTESDETETVTTAVSKEKLINKKETEDTDDSDEEDEPTNNPNVEGFSNFSNRKVERFGSTSSSSDWKLPTSPRFYLNVGLRSLLFACLFYIFAHYETKDYLMKSFKLSKDGSLYVLMAMFFVFYFALNIFL